ncbi:hypothetical protein [Cerasicoccus frondis]|uniref:hypothetical protein n=1 Tax=Cerasicoccus frondis TaxID=490090 RepID=UPI002852D677|nr:hypothetical protein [Cerasicoccus frondis]
MPLKTPHLLECLSLMCLSLHGSHEPTPVFAFQLPITRNIESQPMERISKIKKGIALLKGDFAIVTLAELVGFWVCGLIPGLLIGAGTVWLIMGR